MPLDLSENEKLALITLLTRIIPDDRYPLSARVRTLKDILAKRSPDIARAFAAERPRATTSEPCQRPATRIGALT